MDKECKKCLKKSFIRLIKKYPMDECVQKKLVKEMELYISKLNSNIATPEIARTLYEIFTETTNIPDPFKKEKKKSNDIVLNQYNDYKKLIQESEDPFNTALKLAIAGNIIDFVACPDNYEDTQYYLKRTIEKVLSSGLAIDNLSKLKERIGKAKCILVLGDNCGEIVFDKLFISMLHHNNIHYAVRGFPILNDVTLEDAYYIGINSYANVISNGYNAPSTILSKSSKEFINIFNEADLIISKGQGNYEGLVNCRNQNLFFLMMVKCDVIARKIGANKNECIVLKNTNHE